MRFIRSRNEKSLGDLQMKDFPRGMYVMDDEMIMDFVFTENIEDMLADPEDDPEQFEEDVKEMAKMFGVRPKDIADGDGWKNVGTLYYDLYDEDGEFLEKGLPDSYCKLETFEHCNKRRLGGVMPVQRIPDEIADEWRY